MESTANLTAKQVDVAIPESRIAEFFKQFDVTSLAGRCGITKAEGVTPGKLLSTLVSLPLLGQTIYRAVVRNSRREIGKDAVYDFLTSSRFS